MTEIWTTLEIVDKQMVIECPSAMGMWDGIRNGSLALRAAVSSCSVWLQHRALYG